VVGPTGAVLLAIWVLIVPCPVRAGGLDDLAQIHIAAQPLTFALIALARQTGLQVMMATSELDSLQSPGAEGRMSARVALETLLRGTPLRYREVGARSVAIHREEPLSSAPLNSITSQSAPTADVPGAYGATKTAELPNLQLAAEASSDGALGYDLALLLADQRLEEIIVTAERFAVDVMHAPVSMTAINGDTLQREEIHQLEDLQFYVPGLSVTNTPFSTAVNIRGVGLTFGSPNIAQGVPIYRDNLLVPTNIGDEPLWDVANAQVLRGPQGTLVGADSTGGALFVNTVNPAVGGSAGGYAQLTGGDFHHIEAQSAVNLPPTNSLAIRVGAYYERRDSYSRNRTAMTATDSGSSPTATDGRNPGDLDRSALRATALWEPTAQLQVLAKLDYFHNLAGYVAEKPIPIASTQVNGAYTSCPAPGSFFGTNPVTWGTVPALCGFAPFAPADPYKLAYASGDSFMEEQIWREHLEGKFQFDSGLSLRLLAGASFNTLEVGGENTASPNYTGGSTTLAHEHTLTYEADLLSAKARPLQWAIGGFWWTDPSHFVYRPVSYSGGPFGTGQGFSLPTGGMLLNGGNRRSSYAVFGNVSYPIAPAWKLEAGARETWDRNTNPFVPCPAALDNSACYYGDANAFHFLSPDPSNPWGPLLLNGNGRKNLGSESDALFTWLLSLDYNLGPQSFFYGEIATGAKAGGIRTNIPGDNFAPERDTNFEIGWKATGSGGKTGIQLNAFYMNYTNMQIRAADIVSGQASIYNAGHAGDYGIEFAAHAGFSHWQLAATGSWVKSSFTLGNIVNQDACNLYAPCRTESAGQCPPGVPDGLVPGAPGSTCFNYRNGGAYIDGQFFPWVESVSGLQLPNSATFQGSLSVGYTVPISSGGSLTPVLDLSYQGEQYSQIYDTPLDLYPARTNLNFKISYEWTGWLLAAFATNLTAATYPVAQNDQNAQIFNAPRQFGVRITRRW